MILGIRVRAITQVGSLAPKDHTQIGTDPQAARRAIQDTIKTIRLLWSVKRAQRDFGNPLRGLLSADNAIQGNIKMAQDLWCASSAFPGDTKTKQDSSTV